MTDPLVSIITPAFNAAEFIGETIASVQAQTHRDWEMIIIDDGSTDHTFQVIRAAAESDPRIQAESIAHTGLPASARNAALSRARGRYLAFLDADDLWRPEKLEKQVAALALGGDWVFTNSEIFGGGELLPDGVKYGSGWRPSEPFFPELFVTEGVPFSSVLASRSVLEKITAEGSLGKLFDESPALKAVEDWDLTLRLSQAAEPMYIAEALSHYRAHAGGVSKAPEKNYERTSALIDKFLMQGTSSRLCAQARRRQLSKRSANRMLTGSGPWRMDMLRACALPPRNSRDLYFTLLAISPRPLALRLYKRGIQAVRKGK